MNPVLMKENHHPLFYTKGISAFRALLFSAWVIFLLDNNLTANAYVGSNV
jgi:hypothetical protein